jgi:hypothetical protein
MWCCTDGCEVDPHLTFKKIPASIPRIAWSAPAIVSNGAHLCRTQKQVGAMTPKTSECPQMIPRRKCAGRNERHGVTISDWWYSSMSTAALKPERVH